MIDAPCERDTRYDRDECAGVDVLGTTFVPGLASTRDQRDDHQQRFESLAEQDTGGIEEYGTTV